MVMRALSTAATGMKAQELNIEVISNNIANINTTAFQRERAEFQDLLYQIERRAGVASSDAGTTVPTGIHVGLGVKTGGIYRIPEQGELMQTHSEFDMAIQGRGYFQVTLPSGETAYTRAGSFQLNNESQIVTADGYLVNPGITIPEDAISVDINSSGEVYVNLTAQAAPQLVGQFELADFMNTPGLNAIGNNLFTETASSGPAAVSIPGINEYGTILQKWLETSNVNPITEITSLIGAQRAYELCSKIIQAGDEMLQTVNQSKR
jgi:flagellar basal-body rod protein FlgG